MPANDLRARAASERRSAAGGTLVEILLTAVYGVVFAFIAAEMGRWLGRPR
jgi:hypothetical protein